mmetsp:Transcript_5926/g.16865  ORF Transcript_5926/g.16865 Transcript_5926/m.16865 type:complete len:254 (-) Transcript_5926:2134-2895(-)
METSQKRFITLFNFLGVPYSNDVSLPSGREFQKVLIQEQNIELFRGGDLNNITITLPLRESTFDQIFDESAIVIIHDCMFRRDSFLVLTDDFFDHGGMEALVRYFQKGGTIYVHCVEGIFAIGEMLSEKFGCRWKLQNIESEYVVTTQRGRQLLGGDTIASSPMYCGGKVHFMRCPKGEGLVARRMYTKEQFIEEWQPEEDEEESFLRYLKNEGGQFAICIYEGFGLEGKVIWNGDRGQNPGLKRTFEQLLTL